MSDDQSCLPYLVVRTSRDGENPGVWSGYDEIVDGKPSGRIITGWHFDKTRRMVTHYAKSRHKDPVAMPAETETVVYEPAPPVVTPAMDEPNHIDSALLWSEFDAALERLRASLAGVQVSPTSSDLPKRYKLVFTWDHGREECPIACPDDAIRQRDAIIQKFPHMNPFNFHVVTESYRIDEIKPL